MTTLRTIFDAQRQTPVLVENPAMGLMARKEVFRGPLISRTIICLADARFV